MGGVVTPKVGIAIFLLYMGLQWLTATETYGGLILNALALQFIVHVDEILYIAFYPQAFKDMVEGSTIEIPARDHTREAKQRTQFVNFVVNIISTVLIAFGVFLYFHYFQTVLPNFEYDIHEPCAEFLDGLRTLQCSAFSASCFPKGNGT